jgi:hypothetical protein
MAILTAQPHAIAVGQENLRLIPSTHSSRQAKGGPWGELLFTRPGTAAHLILFDPASQSASSPTIPSSGRQVQWIDRNGDGKAEEVRVREADLTYTFHSPERGQFLLLDISGVRSQARLNLRYSLSPDRRSYAAYSVAASRPQVLNRSASVSCEDDQSILNDSRNLRSFIERQSRQDLANKIRPELIFDASCERDPAFKESLPLMRGAVVDLLQSAHVANGSSSCDQMRDRGGSGTGAPSYLQCLRCLDLDPIANHIEAEFAKILDAPGSKGSPPAVTLACRRESNGTRTASYDPISERVVFHMASADLAARYGRTTEEQQSRFTRSLFHELVHHAGVSDESSTEDLEACCAAGSSPDAAKACERSRLLAKEQNAMRAMRKMLFSGQDRYRDLLRQMDRGHGGAAGQKMSDELLRRLARNFARFGNSRPECAADPVPTQCETDFRKELDRTVTQFFEGSSGDLSSCAAMSSANTELNQGGRNAGLCSSYRASFCDLTGMCLDRSGQPLPGGALCADSMPRQTKISPSATRHAWLFAKAIPRALAQQSCSRRMTYALISDYVEASNRDLSQDGVPLPISPGDIANSQQSIAPRDRSNEDADKIEPGIGRYDVSLTQPTPRPTDNSPESFRAMPPRDTLDSIGERPNPLSSTDRDRVLSRDDRDTQDSFYGSRDQRQREAQIRDQLREQSRFSQVAREALNRVGREVLPEAQAQGDKLARRPAAEGPGMPLARERTFAGGLPNPFAGSAGGASPAGPPGPVLASAGATRPGALAPREINQSAAQSAALDRRSTHQASVVAPRSMPTTSSGPVAGLAPRAAREQGADGLTQLLSWLTGPYKEVKARLPRPDTTRALMRERVQVIDDTGRVFGDSNPLHRLIFDDGQKRLVRGRQ